MTDQSVNPNNGQLVKSFEHVSAAQLDKSLAGAESCYQTWKHKSHAERAVIVVGGIKDSGYGRELGDMGIQEFVFP